MRGRKYGHIFTKMLAWMLVLVVLCTSVPVDGMRVYAGEEQAELIAIDENVDKDMELDNSVISAEEDGNTEQKQEILAGEIAGEKDDNKVEKEPVMEITDTSDDDKKEDSNVDINTEGIEIKEDEDESSNKIQENTDSVEDVVSTDDLLSVQSYYDDDFYSGISINDIIYSGDWGYIITESGEASIREYVGDLNKDIIIPEYIDGYKVTEIYNIRPFEFEYDSLKKIEFGGKLVIPNTVKVIKGGFGYTSFKGDLSIPNSVHTIGYMAFADASFTGKLILPSSLRVIDDYAFSSASFGVRTSLIIPDGVTYIGKMAFCGINKDSLDPKGFTGKLVIPNSVQYIGEGAFINCGSNITLTLPEGITKISKWTFEDNGFKGTLRIPDSVELIEEDAFSGCGTYYDSSKGYLVPYELNLVLPKNLKIIEDKAFYDCALSGEIIIPNGVEELGEQAFRTGAMPLKTIDIPGTIETIPSYAFYQNGNSNRTENVIRIREGVKRIEEDAFGYAFFGHIYLPETLEYIDEYAFYGHMKSMRFHCVEGSYAYNWAKENGVYVILEKSQSSCELSFNANGGTGKAISKLRLVKTDEQEIPECTFTRSGYTFSGWNTKKDGSGESFTPGDYVKYTDFYTATVTLYAQWNPDRYPVTYNTNGGTNSEQNPSYIEYGKKFTLKAASKPGYNFAGWYKEPALKTKVSTLEGSKKMAYTLYAKWTLATYTISYVLPKEATNDKTNPKNYKMTDSAKSLKPATMKGYDFGGWYLDAELTNRVESITTGMYGNLKLYPKWNPHTYTIRYNSNGGAGGSTSNTTHKYKTSGSVAACGYTKTGYHLTKWNTKSNGKGKAYAAGYDKNDLTTTDGEVIDFYAQWAANTYTVTYNGNGASSGKTSNTTMTFDKSGTLAKNGFKKTGYTFVEWNTKSDGSGNSFGAGKKGTFNLTSVNNGTFELFAIWKPIQYKIVFKAPDKKQSMTDIVDIKYDSEVLLPNCSFTQNGCYFVGWSLKSDGSTGIYNAGQRVRNLTVGSSITLYPIWNYDINFDANGGDGTMSTQQMPYNKSTALVKSTFTRTGYEFAGWETTIDGRVKKLKDNEGVKNLFNSNGAKVVLKAVWKANTYEVWFTEENDKGASSKKIVKATYDKDFTIPANTVARKNYDFVGWNTKSDGSGKYYFPGDIVKNLTVDSICMPLYAIWTKRVEVKEITADESINITLSNGSVDLNGKVVISPENATNKKLNWTIVSQNPTGCATIDTTTGVLTPKKEGTVKVKATATDGSGKTKEIEISIIKCTKVVFPLDTAINWKCFTYSGHGNAYKSAYSSLDINKKDDSSAEGYKVYAMAAGEVVSIMDSNGQVVIKHSSPLITTNGVEYKAWYSLYAHMKNISVSVGNKIDAGQQIGLTSMVGNASGPHLHINIMSAEDGVSWSQNNDIKYAISPYYVYGIVDSDGNDMPYLTCDREGPVTEERLINHKPSK